MSEAFFEKKSARSQYFNGITIFFFASRPLSFSFISRREIKKISTSLSFLKWRVKGTAPIILISIGAASGRGSIGHRSSVGQFCIGIAFYRGGNVGYRSSVSQFCIGIQVGAKLSVRDTRLSITLYYSIQGSPRINKQSPIEIIIIGVAGQCRP